MPPISASVASATSSRARKPMRYMLRATCSVTPSMRPSWAIASSSICLNFDSLMMSSFQPVRCHGEADVLALAADGERELLVGDDELHAPVRLVDDDLVDLGRLDRGADEARRIAVPRDDVDLLAAQLLHDRLDARALHADARADRIDVRVAAHDGDLRARARLTGARRRSSRCPRRSRGPRSRRASRRACRRRARG